MIQFLALLFTIKCVELVYRGENKNGYASDP